MPLREVEKFRFLYVIVHSLFDVFLTIQSLVYCHLAMLIISVSIIFYSLNVILHAG